MLTLNLAPIRFSVATMRVGRLAYEDEDKYRMLRETHRTHAFRFDSRTGGILNIGLAADTAALGEVSDVPVQEHLLLLGKAVQGALFAWLAGRRTILRPAKPLQCWGSSRKAALLSAAIREAGLEPTPGLEVLVRHSFDTRVVLPVQDGAAPLLALLLDISTSNEIALSVADLITAGLDPRGLYVCRPAGGTEELRPRLDTLGCVAAVEGGRLVLTDTELTGPVEAGTVFPEPRQETLETVVRLFYPADAARILVGLQRRRQPYASAGDKLLHIAEVLDRYLAGFSRSPSAVGCRPRSAGCCRRTPRPFRRRSPWRSPACCSGRRGAKPARAPMPASSGSAPINICSTSATSRSSP